MSDIRPDEIPATLRRLENRVFWLEMIVGAAVLLVVLALIPPLAVIVVIGLYGLAIIAGVMVFLRLIIVLLNHWFGPPAEDSSTK